MHFDLIGFIKAAGYIGVFGFVFAESGLFIGFMLPGDSLLFAAGFLASIGVMNIWTLSIGSFIAAVLGVSVGYAFGKRVGPAIFNKEDSFFFDKSHLERSRIFFEKYGGKTLILARFIPFVRTFTPILAGVGKMRYGPFLAYNLIGAALWGAGLPLLGYFLGSAIPDIDKYLLPIILLIIVVSVAPAIYHIVKDPESRKKIISLFKRNPKI